MSRARILRPLWQSLQRPAVHQFRAASTASTASDAAASTENNKLQTEAPDVPENGLPPPLLLHPEINALLGQPEKEAVRLPRAVQALYLKPLRREAEYGVPTCDIQLRSYSVPNLEFFCDFALRAAYYLGLPAFGPVPLPRITERWTVPKSHFIFKKSQENFERITLRRLIQIRDGHPETVQIWLAFLQKHAYYGIGMKANIWEYSKLDVGKHLDAASKSMEELVDEKAAQLQKRRWRRKVVPDTAKKVEELLESDRFQKA